MRLQRRSICTRQNSKNTLAYSFLLTSRLTEHCVPVCLRHFSTVCNQIRWESIITQSLTNVHSMNSFENIPYTVATLCSRDAHIAEVADFHICCPRDLDL